jgi:SAM-dependent methyltransferase
VPGCFVEAGCAFGATTVFLKKFMRGEKMDRDYYAIDTFSGFDKEHVDYEVRRRGKSRVRSILQSKFSENRKAWFDRTMAMHSVSSIKSVEADIRNFDFSAIAPIAFCLLDVDLYIPIRDSLPRIYAALAPGGVLVVDDCQPHELWDGALQAYEEFTQENGIPREIACEKLGVVRARS